MRILRRSAWASLGAGLVLVAVISMARRHLDLPGGWRIVAGLIAVLLAGANLTWPRPGLWVSFGVLAVARFIGFTYGWLAGDDLLRTTNILLAIATAGLVAYHGWKLFDPPRAAQGQQQASPSRVERVTAVVSLLAVPAAVIGLAQLLSPGTPNEALAPACRGASVAGAKFLATTQDAGVNSRSGPATVFPQVQRFSGNCTIGFDGYCIGEPVDDFVYGLPDIRWLIPHRSLTETREGYVASGEVRSQSPESDLGNGPRPRCGGKNGPGLPEPAALNVHSKINGDFVDVSPSGAGVQMVGIALFYTRPTLDRSGQMVQVFLDWKSGWGGKQFQGELPMGQYGRRVGRNTRMVLLATSCIGVGVPQASGQAEEAYKWTGTRIVKLPGPRLTPDQEKRLKTAACRVDPNVQSDITPSPLPHGVQK